MPGVVKFVTLIEEYMFNGLELIKQKFITEVHNYAQTETDARPLRPDDLAGGTAVTFQTTATVATAVNVYGTTASQQIRTSQGIVIVGWYVPEDFDTDGYCSVQIQGVTRNVIQAQAAFNQPGHVLYTPDQIVFAQQNTTINIYLYNGQAAAITSGAGPLAYIIGNPKQLLIE